MSGGPPLQQHSEVGEAACCKPVSGIDGGQGPCRGRTEGMSRPGQGKEHEAATEELHGYESSCSRRDDVGHYIQVRRPVDIEELTGAVWANGAQCSATRGAPPRSR